MKRTLLLAVPLLTLIAVGMAVRVGAQTPLAFDELGAGARATAMGQAFTGLADDAAAAYYNPAGLTQLKSPTCLTLGYVYAKPLVKVKFLEDPEKNPWLGRNEFNQTEDFATRALYVGFGANFGEVPAFKVLPVVRRFSLGISLFTNLPEANQFDNPQRPQDPYVLKYNERWALISFALSFGCYVNDWLSVGAGVIPRVDALQQSRGSWIDLRGTVNPGDPARGFRLDLKQTTKLGATPIAGILVRPRVAPLEGRVILGASYRGKVDGYYGTGPVSADVYISRRGNDPFVIHDDPGGRTVDYIGFSPEQVTGGISCRLLGRMTVSCDVTWKRYSDFRFFWHLPPFAFEEGVAVEQPLNDVWVPRVGLEYTFLPVLSTRYLEKITEMSVRGGYYHEPTPVPDMSGTMNVLDADQNVLSGGLEIRYDADWTGHTKLELFFQAHLLEEHTIENDRDPLFGPIRIGGGVYSGGVMLSVVY